MNALIAHRFFIALIAALLIALPLHAVSAEQNQPQQEERESLEVHKDELLQPWVGDLSGMVDRRVIRVLTTYSKTFFFINKGTPRGVTHDMFMAFEREFNARLLKEEKLKQDHLKVRIIFVPVARDQLFTALNEGRGDIAAANLTITPERQKRVDFTVPLYLNAQELLLSGPHSPKVETLEQLSGKTVFVRLSSSYYESLKVLNAHFAKTSRSPIVLEIAPESLEDEDLIEMLNAGLIPLIVVDRHKAEFWKQVFPKIQIHENIVLRNDANIAWAVRKNSPELLALLNDFVKENGQGSKLGNTILFRYLKSAEYVKSAATEKERRKLLKMVYLFRKYGRRYDVDWLLMAAQGYQESRLNQSARSHVGAIGVMQVMPRTGRELNVGDIRKLGPNIHAGVKYMRWMIDNYYGDEPMTQLDKALFAFASYNAGAARIGRLRTETKMRGFDPDVWFGNVEYLAAERIGAETVTYVSNIYKYYIAYRLIMDEIARKAKDTGESRSEPALEQVNKPTKEVRQTTVDKL